MWKNISYITLYREEIYRLGLQLMEDAFIYTSLKMILDNITQNTLDMFNIEVSELLIT